MNHCSAAVPRLELRSDFEGIHELAITQLAGFTEDADSLRFFERRYMTVMLPAAAACFGSIYIGIFHDGAPAIFVSVFFGGFLVIAAAFVHMLRTRPISRLSGRPMLRFRRSDAPDGVVEWIYVDPESRSYFCRVIQAPD